MTAQIASDRSKLAIYAVVGKSGTYVISCGQRTPWTTCQHHDPVLPFFTEPHDTLVILCGCIVTEYMQRYTGEFAARRGKFAAKGVIYHLAHGVPYQALTVARYLAAYRRWGASLLYRPALRQTPLRHKYSSQYRLRSMSDHCTDGQYRRHRLHPGVI